MKVLHGDGYKIVDKMADDRFFFTEDAEYFDTVDMMERHIGVFFVKGVVYLVLTDPQESLNCI